MSTEDQKLSAALHSEALLLSQRPELQPLIDELKEYVGGRDDIRIECAGTIAGAWFASPGSAYVEDLIAAGLLLAAGPFDGDLLVQWVKTGFERRVGQWKSYDPSG